MEALKGRKGTMYVPPVCMPKDMFFALQILPAVLVKRLHLCLSVPSFKKKKKKGTKKPPKTQPGLQLLPSILVKN